MCVLPTKILYFQKFIQEFTKKAFQLEFLSTEGLNDSNFKKKGLRPSKRTRDLWIHSFTHLCCTWGRRKVFEQQNKVIVIKLSLCYEHDMQRIKTRKTLNGERDQERGEKAKCRNKYTGMRYPLLLCQTQPSSSTKLINEVEARSAELIAPANQRSRIPAKPGGRNDKHKGF